MDDSLPINADRALPTYVVALLWLLAVIVAVFLDAPIERAILHFGWIRKDSIIARKLYEERKEFFDLKVDYSIVPTIAAHLESRPSQQFLENDK